MASVGQPPVAGLPAKGDGDPTVTSGAALPFWLGAGGTKQAQFPKLGESLDTDVCVIGAGIAGLTVAYTLAKRGVGVVVLDDGNIASGETGRTSAHLMSNMDDRFTRLEYLHGADGAQLAAASHQEAINYIETIVRDEAIDCGFKRLDGYLFEKESHRADTRNVRIEMEAALRSGLQGVYLVPRAPCPGLDTGEAYCAPRQARFHPIHYCNGLARAAAKHGARIYTKSRANSWAGSASHRGTVDVDGGHTVNCKHIVVATNTPEQNRLIVHAKLAINRCGRRAGAQERNTGWGDALTGACARALACMAQELRGDGDDPEEHVHRRALLGHGRPVPLRALPGGQPRRGRLGRDHRGRRGPRDRAAARRRRDHLPPARAVGARPLADHGPHPQLLVWPGSLRAG